MKKKNIILIIAVFFVGIALAGGTYAYLTSTLNVTNGNYNTITGCFDITYNINNVTSGQDITGTMFPSSGPSGGLSGRVGIKTTNACNINGTGELKLHINSGTSSSLMSPSQSYCEDRRTLEAMSGVTTEAACDTAGGRWRGYGDAYCENNATLQRLTDYTTQSDCTSNGGSWKTGGSPLKYAIYDNASATGTPLSVGRIASTDIGNDITIYENFLINNTQAYYHIFIWMDGYLIGNSDNTASFDGYITASAIQRNPYAYTANLGANVTKGSAIPNTITVYNTPAQAMAALKTAGGGTTDYPFFLRHTINNNVVTESYVGFVVTSEMAASNSGMTAGTYYLKGGDKGAAYNDNKAILQSAFGSAYCADYSSHFDCHVSGLDAYAYSGDFVQVGPVGRCCYVNNDGISYCSGG